MTTFAILLGGDLVATPRFRELVADARPIAADSGIKHAASLPIEPELWVGDFDSADAIHVETYRHVKRLEFPSDKDKTDGEIAVDEALKLGASKLVFVGAFGGKRTDHMFLHMTLALRLAGKNIEVVLTDGLQEGHVVSTHNKSDQLASLLC